METQAGGAQRTKVAMFWTEEEPLCNNKPFVFVAMAAEDAGRFFLALLQT